MAAKSSPELWILFDRGFKPRELISAGYKLRTVYAMHARYRKEIRLKANAVDTSIRKLRG